MYWNRELPTFLKTCTGKSGRWHSEYLSLNIRRVLSKRVLMTLGYLTGHGPLTCPLHPRSKDKH
eukprot:12914610-Prorocentrum_lima.AAC.1